MRQCVSISAPLTKNLLFVSRSFSTPSSTPASSISISGTGSSTSALAMYSSSFNFRLPNATGVGGAFPFPKIRSTALGDRLGGALNVGASTLLSASSRCASAAARNAPSGAPSTPIDAPANADKCASKRFGVVLALVPTAFGEYAKKSLARLKNNFRSSSSLKNSTSRLGSLVESSPSACIAIRNTISACSLDRLDAPRHARAI
mmetsp:Transcript_2140/g.8377  ORF Transcript_2140/g.8377 Transcript_2140/m.8377 type:complete len:204 (-) Transcript_2140:329-940(-)